ncbi:MAG TPA: nuclear transport factor 2 family protein [Pseudolabrys sp.]|nr:nuclear transport factor 2 family protein [Pseudolabrys sp.]
MTTTTPTPRRLVEDFYAAYAKRDLEVLETYLDDEVDWSVVGPIDVIHFCGQRRGKAAVMDFFRRAVPEVLDITGFNVEELLIDGDRAAAFGRLWAVFRPTSRSISYRVSHLVHFRNRRVVRFCSMIDSFDAAEQMLGHAIDLHLDTNADSPWAGNLVAV